MPESFVSLPDYHDVANKVHAADTLTALERLVFEYEPSGIEDCRRFRELLQQVLEDVVAKQEDERCTCGGSR